MPQATDSPPAAKASRFLEGALVFTILAHLMAMGSMMLLLLGIPGGLRSDLAGRAGYVAHHPWLWRVGWLGWQITAVSDFLLAIALLRTEWVPKLAAVVVLVATVAAMIPDQIGQFRWTWIGTDMARRSVTLGAYAEYGRFEARTFVAIGGWAAAGYTVAALGWTWCMVAGGVWSRRLTWVSVEAWGVFAISTGTLLLNRNELPAGVLKVTSIGNAIGFLLLMVWLVLVSEMVLRRCRLDKEYGRYARWRHPSAGIWARACEVVANSRLARAMGELLPALPMDSDITNVVYVNYLVEAERLERFVVAPLRLQRLGTEGKYALFTFLTFRHGHFGARCFGRLRRVWPSPIQSNWRIHVYDPVTNHRGIQFLTIAIDSTPHALAARLLAEEIPMHVAEKAWMSGDVSGTIEFGIEAGTGTAADVRGQFVRGEAPELVPPWSVCFASWMEVLKYIVPQDRAMSAQPWINRITRQEIILDIPLESCLPMLGEVESRAAREIVGEATPLCFGVARLKFRLLNEVRDDVRQQSRDSTA